MHEIIRQLVSALRGPRYDRLRRAFTIWINQVIIKRAGVQDVQSFNALQEVEAMLAERVTEWTQEWKQQGIREGEARGLLMGTLAGTRDTLLSLLSVRFGDIPPSLSEKLHLIEKTEILRELTTAILTADTIEAFEIRVNQAFKQVQQ